MLFAPVPPSIDSNIRGWFASDGERWLAALPEVVAERLAAWSLRPVGDPLDGGTHSYVLPVEREDGSSAVLKVLYVDDENRAEPTALRAWDGEGAVRLFEYERATGAMLLERAEPGEPLLECRFGGLDETESARRQVAIACGLYRRLWRPFSGPEPGFPDLPDAQEMLDGIEERLADPPEWLDRRRRDRGLELCSELRKPGEVGIGNRDTHLSNIISAQREDWLLIDPKPYLAERAFDGSFFLIKQLWHGLIGGPELLLAVAEGIGADLERVRAWALVRAIEQALEWPDPNDIPAFMDLVETLAER